jgi:tetratricopeptide (TPR) repeat protein
VSVLRRFTCIAVVVGLIAAPRWAAAQPAATEPPPATEEPDAALAAAKAAHEEADAKYNTADYQGAIDAWQRAYAALPRTPESNTYRTLINYNIAAAYEKLFDLDGKVSHLKQAKVLLEKFEESIAEIYADAPADGEAERAQVQEKLRRIEKRIAEAEGRTSGAATEPEPKPEPVPDEPGPREKKPGRGLIIGGGVLVGLGVGALAGMVPALVIGERENDIADLDPNDYEERGAQFEGGRRANRGAIAAGVLAGVFVGAGIALIVVGAKRRSAKTAFAPSIGPRGAGLSIHGRF